MKRKAFFWIFGSITILLIIIIVVVLIIISNGSSSSSEIKTITYTPPSPPPVSKEENRSNPIFPFLDNTRELDTTKQSKSSRTADSNIDLMSFQSSTPLYQPDNKHDFYASDRSDGPSNSGRTHINTVEFNINGIIDVIEYYGYEFAIDIKGSIYRDGYKVSSHNKIDITKFLLLDGQLYVMGDAGMKSLIYRLINRTAGEKYLHFELQNISGVNNVLSSSVTLNGEYIFISFHNGMEVIGRVYNFLFQVKDEFSFSSRYRVYGNDLSTYIDFLENDEAIVHLPSELHRVRGVYNGIVDHRGNIIFLYIDMKDRYLRLCIYKWKITYMLK
jgi:hypothetical protein